MKTIQTIVIMLAIAIAYILFIFGIRRIKLSKVSRYNLFLGTLFLMLGFLSLNKLSYAQEDKSSVSRQPEKKPQLRSSRRIAILNNTPEWKNFKAFWKKLDQIKPKKSRPDIMEVYSNSISREQRDSLKEELQNMILNLEKLERRKISQLEINAIEQICENRIDSFGVPLSMMTRMFIPVLIAKDNLLNDLELKIDKLLELKKERLISKEEFQHALLNIQVDIKAFCVLNTIYKYYYPYLQSQEISLKASKYPFGLIDDFILKFEKSYAEYLVKKKEGKMDKGAENYYKGIDQKYLETKQALEELKTAFPGLDELVADLENV